MISIKVKGKDSVIRDLQRQLGLKAEVAKKVAAHSLKNDLVKATPIDTGEAREGWKVRSDRVENDVAHIEELNNGSSQQAPARFIEKTVINNRRVRPNGIIVRKK